MGIDHTSNRHRPVSWTTCPIHSTFDEFISMIVWVLLLVTAISKKNWLIIIFEHCKK